MSRAPFAIVAALFALASVGLAVALTGLDEPQSAGPRLAAAGSPVSPAIVALIAVVIVGGIAFLVIGRVRRNKGE